MDQIINNNTNLFVPLLKPNVKILLCIDLCKFNLNLSDSEDLVVKHNSSGYLEINVEKEKSLMYSCYNKDIGKCTLDEMSIDEKFYLDNIYIYCPSLHSVYSNNEKNIYDGEIFLVFKNKVENDGIQLYNILCVFLKKTTDIFESSNANKLLGEIMLNIPDSNTTKNINNIKFDINDLIPNNKTFYNYVHTENDNINWYVYQNPLIINDKYLKKYIDNVSIVRNNNQYLTGINAYNQKKRIIQNIDVPDDLHYYESVDLDNKNDDSKCTIQVINKIDNTQQTLSNENEKTGSILGSLFKSENELKNEMKNINSPIDPSGNLENIESYVENIEGGNIVFWILNAIINIGYIVLLFVLKKENHKKVLLILYPFIVIILFIIYKLIENTRTSIINTICTIVNLIIFAISLILYKKIAKEIFNNVKNKIKYEVQREIKKPKIESVTVEKLGNNSLDNNINNLKKQKIQELYHHKELLKKRLQNLINEAKNINTEKYSDFITNNSKSINSINSINSIESLRNKYLEHIGELQTNINSNINSKKLSIRKRKPKSKTLFGLTSTGGKINNKKLKKSLRRMLRKSLKNKES